MKVKNYEIHAIMGKRDVEIIKKALLKYSENLPKVSTGVEARNRLTVNRLLEELDSII